MRMAFRVSFSLFVVVVGLVASAFTGIYAEESESKEFVLTLDHTNFSDAVSKLDFVVVEFYAPWCGHCKKLAPEYEKAASILSSHDPPLVLAKVDASEEVNRGLASDYEVKGFPTIKILRNGGKNVQEYKGPRDADGIVAHLKKQSGPASLEIKTADDVTNLIADKKIAIIGVFPKFSGEEYENFTALADKLRSEYEFGHTLDAKLLPRGESSVTGPVIRLLKPFDELFVDSKDFHTDVVEKFIAESSVPTVTEYNSEPSNHPFVIKFFNNANAKVLLFLNFSSDAADAFRSKYHEIAEKHRTEGLSFLLGDLEISKGAFQYFGIQEDQVPVIIIQTNDGKKYVKSNVESEHIAEWVKEYKDGKLQPYIKSEPIPEQNNEPVKVFVANSLQELLFNSDKNVLLEFYAPWCGHCKKLAPVLDEVAVSYESDPDVVIAKIDATANDIPSEFEVQGYPTIYFKSKSGKLVQYDEDRSKENFIAFIEKNREKIEKPAAEQTDKQDSGKDEL